MHGSALQASIASGVNQTVRLPRARRPASYAAQLVTRCRCLGMRCRRSRLALNGMAGAPLRSRARPHPSLPEGVHPGDPCNNVTEMYKWRHLIENFFCKLKEFKRIAIRADKTDQSFEA